MFKKFEIDTDYDMQFDIYTITVKDDFKFGHSLELEEGIILDFDENNIPISIEILDISERLNINKNEINSANVQMKIISTEDILEITIDFYYIVHEQEFSQTFDSKIANTFNIPQMELATS